MACFQPWDGPSSSCTVGWTDVLLTTVVGRQVMLSLLLRMVMLSATFHQFHFSSWMVAGLRVVI